MEGSMKAAPAWMRAYSPSLDGLRGIAIALVLMDHMAPRLAGLGLGGLALWGWCGVDLFFVLSGFLITGIILDGRGEPGFFRSFYARRGLRIWPLYALVVPVNYWLCGRANTWVGGGVFWLYFLFLVQNLRPGLSGTLYPSWSLAIEEQFYLAWAPAARYLPASAIAAVLAVILAVEPWVRGHWALNPVNTLYHLDGLAVGALIALGLRTLRWPRTTWARVAWAAVGAGALGLAWAARGHGAWLNSFLALGFGGCVLLALEGEGRASLWVRGLRLPALRFLGRISYGLYLTQVIVFALLGGVDERLDRAHAGAAGDLVIIAMRTVAAIAVAAALWYGFERPILRLKRFFPRQAEAQAPQPAATAAN